MTASARTLYATPEADRFFLVVDDCELPVGDLVIVGTDGRNRSVEEAALAPFEITKEQAHAHLLARIEHAVGATADTISAALGLGAQRPDLGEVAERLGIHRGDLERDPGAVRAALQALADDVGAVSAAVASGRPGDLLTARARLESRGIDLGDALDELPHALEEIRQLDQERAKAAAASGLRALADAIEDTSEQPLGRRIDELVERLEREIGPWLGRDPEKLREQRREEYRTSARSSIADALREAGITPLNDQRDDPA